MLLRARLLVAGVAVASSLAAGLLVRAAEATNAVRASSPATGLRISSTRSALWTQELTLDDGVYTEAQADRGAELYRRACSECHLPDEYKGYLRRWVGVPVSFFFESVRSTMPQDNPGALDRDEYADVLTYIFRINGAPMGEEEMSAEQEALDAIQIVVPAEGSD